MAKFVFAVLLILMTATAFNDKYFKRVEDETQRLIKLKKGPLVREIRHTEMLLHRYEFTFNETVLKQADEEEKKEAFQLYMNDYQRKYSFDFDRYFIAQDVCRARFPDDINCENEKITMDWNFWHDFRQEPAKSEHIEKLKGQMKEHLKTLKKIDL